MSQLVLDRNARLLLQAKAHHLDPVVLLGGNGLTEAVIKEVDRALTAHGLIKMCIRDRLLAARPKSSAKPATDAMW